MPDEAERQSRAKVPALEAEVVRLREQVQMARAREEAALAELRTVRGIVRSILDGLGGPQT